MSLVRHLPATTNSPEGGFALPELLVAMVVGLIAIAAVLFFVVTSQQHNSTVFERVGAVDDTSLALKRLQDRLRQSYKILPMPAVGGPPEQTATLSYQAIVATGGSFALHTFVVDCSQAGTISGTFDCLQTDQTTGSSEVAVSGLVGPTSGVFTVQAPQTKGLPRVDIAISQRLARSSSPVRLTSSVEPRNCQAIALTSGACPFP